jgi:hypothetical protein
MFTYWITNNFPSNEKSITDMGTLKNIVRRTPLKPKQHKIRKNNEKHSRKGWGRNKQIPQ